MHVIAAHADANDATNVPPNASFVFTCIVRQCTFDATGSFDLEGPIAAHATGGSYTVTLTVTDHDGATGTLAQSVTVVAPSGIHVGDLDGTRSAAADRLAGPVVGRRQRDRDLAAVPRHRRHARVSKFWKQWERGGRHARRCRCSPAAFNLEGTNILRNGEDAVKNATNIEPLRAEWDAAGVFQGNINYAPYSCP